MPDVVEPVVRQVSTKNWQARVGRMLVGLLTSLLLVIQGETFEGGFADVFGAISPEQWLVVVLGAIGVSYTGKDKKP